MIQDLQSEALSNGIRISINNYNLRIINHKLVSSSDIKPLFSEKNHPLSVNGKKQTVKVKLYAGVSKNQKLSEAGWYVFCDGRMILKADKTEITGWNQKNDEELILKNRETTPKSHYQFANFRGFVYFESEHSALLPWNTTKSGINVESPIYQATKLRMISALHQVIGFLNRLDRENRLGETYLAEMVDSSAELKIGEISRKSAKFVVPKPKPIDDKDQMVKICYHKPKEEFEKVKKLLKARSIEQVGLATFDYFLGMEGDE